jgi:mRNA interferase ChpB
LKRGDIYLVSLDPTLGHEQQGTRPVLILTQEVFNRLTHAPIVAPITSGGDFARRAGFTVSLTGTRTTGVVRCDQLKTIDMTAGQGRRLEAVPVEVMDEVLARVSTLFE